jgi:hypothetical protein
VAQLTNESTGWADAEFGQLDLGDARLNRRARKLMEDMAAQPMASVPKACNGWSETIAAYRFFDNDSVEWRDILEPHWQRTEQRMADEEVVLCLQDTTELDFNGRQAEGLGALSYERQRGMYVHPTYAVTTSRVPLGVLDVWMWAREPKDEDGKRPGPKESVRWIEGYERLAELAPTLPATRLVYVADREADMMELMEKAQDLGSPVDWLLRAAQNRALPNGHKLWAHTTDGEALGQIEFTMTARHGVKARKVRQQLWARRVELRASEGKTVNATCILAREVDAPDGAEPIEWRLLTNRRATSLAEAAELIDWYRARWEIEMFFNVLKNGCEVEALQLGAIKRIERALALYLIVSWRIAHLVRMGRTCPDMDAKLFFDPDEIQAAYLFQKTLAPPNPRLNEVIRLIAKRGGFLGRKRDGEPGAKALWEGLCDVRASAITLKHLRDLGLLSSCV